MKPLIKLQNVSKYYKTLTSVNEGMRDINLEFYNNEFVAITGESGSGKTTLLNVISGLDSYEDGELYINGLETSHFSVKDFEKYRAQNIGFVFQNYNVIESYTVYQNVAIALEAQNYPKHEIKERATELIKKVGLESHLNHRTAKLSGGQKQRVVIARALAKNANIILADEPTGNLDTKSSEEVLSLLKEISKDKLVILVSHNLDEVKKYATRNVVLEDGTVKNDFVLEKTEPKESNLLDVNNKSNSIKKGFKIAIRNIFSTPKRTIFQVLLAMLAVFAFIYFYAGLIKNGSISGLFNSIEQEQLYLAKRDGSEFSLNDLAELDRIAKRDMTFTPYLYHELDASIVVDFNIDVNNNQNNYFQIIKFYASNSEYLRDRDLDEGVLPSQLNHIVVSKLYLDDDKSLLNKEVIIDGKTFIVSGVVNYREYNRIYYFHDNYLFDTTSSLTINNDASFLFSNDYLFDTVKVRGLDRKDIKALMSSLNDNKYQAIDDYGTTEDLYETINTFLMLIYWAVLIVILQILFLVLYHVKKNIMNSRKIDFAVYRSIGISEQEVGFTILFEQLILTIVGTILTFGIFLAMQKISLETYKLIRSVKLLDYIVIALLFIALALRLGFRFNKKIFNLTVIEALKEEIS